MSWAAGRKTTRKEDIAYCLLGIFDVQMPPLYGEGERKAFLRLQLEIIKGSNGHTIFAWPMPRLKHSEDGVAKCESDDYLSGMLAASPAAFKTCGNILTLDSRRGRSAYSMTNRGILMRLLAIPHTTDTYLVRLDCLDYALRSEGDVSEVKRLGTLLRRLYDDDQYIRIRFEHGETFQQVGDAVWESGNLGSIPENSDSVRDRQALWDRIKHPIEKLDAFIPQIIGKADRDFINDRIHGYRLGQSISAYDKKLEMRFKFLSTSDREDTIWNPDTRIVSRSTGHAGEIAFIDVSAQKMNFEQLQLGFDFAYNPVVFLATLKGLKDTSLSTYVAQRVAIWHRHPFDVTAWSKISGGIALALPEHPGLWATRGDRVNGVVVSLVGPVGVVGRLSLTREVFRVALIWHIEFVQEKPKGLLATLGL